MTARITIAGLGSGDENQLTLGVWRMLESADRVYLRTERHPVVTWIKQNGISFQTFDRMYESYPGFDEVYDAIANELLTVAAAEQAELVYAVPGHPMVAERTVKLLRERGPSRGVEIAVAGGESFLEQAFVHFGFDPIEGFQLLDGADVTRSRLNPQLHTLIAQVYDSFTASDVKLALMEVFPDDYVVAAGHALGVPGQQRIDRLPLYDLDRINHYGNLSLIFVPRSENELLRNGSFDRLHEIVRHLRSPEGCPWDREQTHASIRKNLIEETYEVLETIDDDDPVAMCEELGDLLLQIMLHSQMEEEEGAFTVYDVIRELNEKLIRRHPHVFGGLAAGTADEGLANWEAAKAEEKRAKGVEVDKLSALSGVPRDLPGLMKALKLQKKAAKVGFDWEQMNEVYDKIEEELQELRAIGEGDNAQAQRAEELGDLLFAVVNLARFMKIDPEEAIALTNRKFIARFEYIEEQLCLNGKKVEQTDLTEMERLWQEAKKVLKT